ncbi:hypothetical protein HDU76_002560 [Blyttiomyces sp. JEL0837]|nr:hypothetical protein HDU76_002560 [Blyttiomyces sp. JEL0837]
MDPDGDDARNRHNLLVVEASAAAAGAFLLLFSIWLGFCAIPWFVRRRKARRKKNMKILEKGKGKANSSSEDGDGGDGKQKKKRRTRRKGDDETTDSSTDSLSDDSDSDDGDKEMEEVRKVGQQQQPGDLEEGSESVRAGGASLSSMSSTTGLVAGAVPAPVTRSRSGTDSLDRMLKSSMRNAGNGDSDALSDYEKLAAASAALAGFSFADLVAGNDEKKLKRVSGLKLRIDEHDDGDVAAAAGFAALIAAGPGMAPFSLSSVNTTTTTNATATSGVDPSAPPEKLLQEVDGLEYRNRLEQQLFMRPPTSVVSAMTTNSAIRGGGSLLREAPLQFSSSPAASGGAIATSSEFGYDGVIGTSHLSRTMHPYQTAGLLRHSTRRHQNPTLRRPQLASGQLYPPLNNSVGINGGGRVVGGLSSVLLMQSSQARDDLAPPPSYESTVSAGAGGMIPMTVVSRNNNEAVASDANAGDEMTNRGGVAFDLQRLEEAPAPPVVDPGALEPSAPPMIIEGVDDDDEVEGGRRRRERRWSQTAIPAWEAA